MGKVHQRRPLAILGLESISSANIDPENTQLNWSTIWVRAIPVYLPF